MNDSEFSFEFFPKNMFSQTRPKYADMTFSKKSAKYNKFFVILIIFVTGSDQQELRGTLVEPRRENLVFNALR